MEQLAKDVLFLVHTYLDDEDVMKQFQLCKLQHTILKNNLPQHPHPFLIFQMRETIQINKYKSLLEERKSSGYWELAQEIPMLRAQEQEEYQNYQSFNDKYRTLKSEYENDSENKSASVSCFSRLSQFYDARKIKQQMQKKLIALLESKRNASDKLSKTKDLIIINLEKSQQIKQPERDCQNEIKLIRQQYETYRHFRNVLSQLPVYVVDPDNAFFTQCIINNVIHANLISPHAVTQMHDWLSSSSCSFLLGNEPPNTDSMPEINASMLEHNIVLIRSNVSNSIGPRLLVHPNCIEIRFAPKNQNQPNKTTVVTKYHSKNSYALPNSVLERMSKTKYFFTIQQVGFLRELPTSTRTCRLFNALLDGKVVEEQRPNSFYLYWFD
jgi:hypothetical protein